VGTNGGEATLLIDCVSQSEVPREKIRGLVETLFPPHALGPEVGGWFRRLRALPVRLAIHQGGPDGPLAGTWEAIEVSSYVFATSDFQVPEGYAAAAAADHSLLRSRGTRRMRRSERDRLDDPRFEPPEVTGRIPNVPVDAGIGFSGEFVRKLGKAASAVVNVFDPLLPTNLQLQLDWYMALRDRLHEVGLVDTALMEDAIVAAVDDMLRKEVTRIQQLNELPDLRRLLDDDQRESLQAVIDSMTGDQAANRWTHWTDNRSRLIVARRYALEVLLKPIDLDMRPQIPYDDPLRVFEEVDAQGNVVEGSGVEVGKLSFFRSGNELYIYHLIDLTNITVHNFRPQIEIADDLLTDVFVRDDGFELVLATRRITIPFDFWTEPAATFWTLAASLVTLGVAYLGLWNIGSGELTFEPAELHFRLRPRLSGARIVQSLEYDEDASHVDVTFWALGWNPLNDMITLMASALVSALDLGAVEVGQQARDAARDVINENRVLAFPDSFSVGSIHKRDAASRIIAAPQEVQTLIATGHSVFYRGIYGTTPPPEIQPLEQTVPRDGTYFFHRRVLESMIAARLGVDGQRLDVTLPALAAPANALIPDEVRNATELGPELLRRMVTLGLMSEEDRRRWQAYLDLRVWLLSFEGMPNGRIPLQPPARGRLRTFQQGGAAVQWADGINGLPADVAVASADVRLTGRHVLEIRFFTERGDDLLPWLAMMEKIVWKQVPLTSGVSFPNNAGAVPILNTSVTARGQLHVGIWDQRPDVTPGFPASFDFAVRKFGGTNAGETKLLATSAYATDARAQAIRDALALVFPDALAKLDRTLFATGRYASFTGVEAGLHWRVASPGGFSQFVRTKGDRLYLDFEIDPLIVENLDEND
jgi:hypothetical protein